VAGTVYPAENDYDSVGGPNGKLVEHPWNQAGMWNVKGHEAGRLPMKSTQPRGGRDRQTRIIGSDGETPVIVRGSPSNRTLLRTGQPTYRLLCHNADFVRSGLRNYWRRWRPETAIGKHQMHMRSQDGGGFGAHDVRQAADKLAETFGILTQACNQTGVQEKGFPA